MNRNRDIETRAGNGLQICQPTAKRIYRTRKNARAGRRQFGNGSELSIYRCPHGDHYHVGHQPDAVRSGEVDKGTWLARTKHGRPCSDCGKTVEPLEVKQFYDTVTDALVTSLCVSCYDTRADA